MLLSQSASYLSVSYQKKTKRKYQSGHFFFQQLHKKIYIMSNLKSSRGGGKINIKEEGKPLYIYK